MMEGRRQPRSLEIADRDAPGFIRLPTMADKRQCSIPSIRQTACSGRMPVRMVDVLRSAAVVSAVPERCPKDLSVRYLTFGRCREFVRWVLLVRDCYQAVCHHMGRPSCQ